MRMADEIVDGKHTRANVNAVVAALDDMGARGVPVPAELAAAIPVVVARLMRADSPRMQAAAVKLALAALRHNLERALAADRIARADQQPGENAAVQSPIKYIEGLGPDVFK
jgi:hypothetical protein